MLWRSSIIILKHNFGRSDDLSMRKLCIRLIQYPQELVPAMKSLDPGPSRVSSRYDIMTVFCVCLHALPSRYLAAVAFLSGQPSPAQRSSVSSTPTQLETGVSATMLTVPDAWQRVPQTSSTTRSYRSMEPVVSWPSVLPENTFSGAESNRQQQPTNHLRHITWLLTLPTRARVTTVMGSRATPRVVSLLVDFLGYWYYSITIVLGVFLLFRWLNCP